MHCTAVVARHDLASSKLSRLGAPSGRLFSKIWRLTLPAIDILQSNWIAVAMAPHPVGIPSYMIANSALRRSVTSMQPG
jgi:hypothetical protein